MILVFGATGTIGDELLAILSSDGVPAVAVTRGPAAEQARPGIRWVQADLAAPASIEGLFSGVRSMFLLTGNHPDMARQQIRAIDAAASAGVEHVVKLSALGASDHAKLPIGRAHHEAEAALMVAALGSCTSMTVAMSSSRARCSSVSGPLNSTSRR